MSEIIEQVARKLEPQAWAALGIGDTLAYANRRKSSIRKAKLAISEMREPTMAMRRAGAMVMPDYDPDVDDAMHCWHEMVDAALTVSPESSPVEPA